MAIDIDSFLDIEFEVDWPVLLFNFDTLIDEGVSAYSRSDIKAAVQSAGDVLHVRVVEEGGGASFCPYDSFFGRGSAWLMARNDVLELLMDSYESHLPQVSAIDSKCFRTLYEFGWHEDFSFRSYTPGVLSAELSNSKRWACIIFKARRFISTQPQDQVFDTLIRMSKILRKSFKITLSDN